MRKRFLVKSLTLICACSAFIFLSGCASDLKFDFQKYLPSVKKEGKVDNKKKDPGDPSSKEKVGKKKMNSKSKDPSSANPLSTIFALKKTSDSSSVSPDQEVKRKGSSQNAQKPAATETPEKILEKANTAYTEGKYYDAAFSYKRWLKLKKEDTSGDTIALVYSRLGEIAQKQTRYQIAMDCFESAVKYSDAKNPQYLFQAGKAHFELGNYLKAEQNFEKIIMIAPDYDQIQYYYGLSLLNQEKIEESRKYLSKALGETEALHLLVEKAYKLKKQSLAQDLEQKMIETAQLNKQAIPVIKNKPLETKSSVIQSVQKSESQINHVEKNGIKSSGIAPVAPLISDALKADKPEMKSNSSVGKGSPEEKDPVPQKIVSASKSSGHLTPFPTITPIFPEKKMVGINDRSVKQPLDPVNIDPSIEKSSQKIEKEIPQLPVLPNKKEESTLVKSLLEEPVKKSDPLPDKPKIQTENKEKISPKTPLAKQEDRVESKNLHSNLQINNEMIVYAPNELFALKLIDKKSAEAQKILVQYGEIIPLKQYKTSHLYPIRPKVSDLMKTLDQPEKIASLPASVPVKSEMIQDKTPVSVPTNTPIIPSPKEKRDDCNKMNPVPAPFAEKNRSSLTVPNAKTLSTPITLPGPEGSTTPESKPTMSSVPFPVVNLNFSTATPAQDLPKTIETSVSANIPYLITPPENLETAIIQKKGTVPLPQELKVQLPDLNPAEIKDSIRIAELEKPKKDPVAFDENSDFGFAESRFYTLTTLPEAYARELGKASPIKDPSELEKRSINSPAETVSNLLTSSSSDQILPEKTSVAQIKDLAQMENRILSAKREDLNVKQVVALQTDSSAKVVPIPAKAVDQNEKKGSFWSNPFKSIHIPNFWSETKK